MQTGFNICTNTSEGCTKPVVLQNRAHYLQKRRRGFYQNIATQGSIFIKTQARVVPNLRYCSIGLNIYKAQERVVPNLRYCSTRLNIYKKKRARVVLNLIVLQSCRTGSNIYANTSEGCTKPEENGAQYLHLTCPQT